MNREDSCIIAHCGKKNMGEWLHMTTNRTTHPLQHSQNTFHHKCVTPRKLLVATVSLVLVTTSIITENCRVTICSCDK